jgi:UDP-glucuronate 4-epimerase
VYAGSIPTSASTYMRVLVTGSAGFIGSNLSQKLNENGHEVFGVDNLNDYYDVKLKKDRKKYFLDSNNIQFKKIDICDENLLFPYLNEIQPQAIIHLAAQAGVRYSKINPKSYISSNIQGFFNIIDFSRINNLEKTIFASSSSVYGNLNRVPFKEKLKLDNPLSLYAASKLSNEIIAKSYSHSFNFSSTGLRFFSVYGPWGRPDMAYFTFTEKILRGEEINLFEKGQLLRDFTYIDDISTSIEKLLSNEDSTNSNCNIYNIGNSKPIKVIDLLKNLEELLNMKAKVIYSGKEQGEVKQTFSDSSKLFRKISFKPDTSFKEGLKKFVEWYLDYKGK